MKYEIYTDLNHIPPHISENKTCTIKPMILAFCISVWWLGYGLVDKRIAVFHAEERAKTEIQLANIWN